VEGKGNHSAEKGGTSEKRKELRKWEVNRRGTKIVCRGKEERISPNGRRSEEEGTYYIRKGRRQEQPGKNGRERGVPDLLGVDSLSKREGPAAVGP